MYIVKTVNNILIPSVYITPNVLWPFHWKVQVPRSRTWQNDKVMLCSTVDTGEKLTIRAGKTKQVCQCFGSNMQHSSTHYHIVGTYIYVSICLLFCSKGNKWSFHMKLELFSLKKRFWSGVGVPIEIFSTEDQSRCFQLINNKSK
jgi:hypothetical protein